MIEDERENEMRKKRERTMKCKKEIERKGNREEGL